MIKWKTIPTSNQKIVEANRVKFDTFTTKGMKVCDLLNSSDNMRDNSLFIFCLAFDIYIVYMTYGKLGSQVQASLTSVHMPKISTYNPVGLSLSRFCVKNLEVYEAYLRSGSGCRLLLLMTDFNYRYHRNYKQILWSFWNDLIYA